MKRKTTLVVVAILLVVTTLLTFSLVGCNKKDVPQEPVVEINEIGANAFIKWMSLASTRELISTYGIEQGYGESLFTLIDTAEIADLTKPEDSLKYEGSIAKTNVVRVSTTTSVNNTGLLPFLQPRFEALGWKLEVQSAGTGAAIKAAKDGNADLILVHSRAAEEQFINQGYARQVEGFSKARLSFMYNYFVVVGPSADPAGIKNSTDVEDAFRSIAETKTALFVSRGDQSGTYNKEITLWPEALGLNKKDPAQQKKQAGDWYISKGDGMGATLKAADEKSAYTLSDNGTYLRYKNDPAGDKIPNLIDLNVTGKNLKNTYSMIAVSQDAFK